MIAFEGVGAELRVGGDGCGEFRLDDDALARAAKHHVSLHRGHEFHHPLTGELQRPPVLFLRQLHPPRFLQDGMEEAPYRGLVELAPSSDVPSIRYWITTPLSSRSRSRSPSDAASTADTARLPTPDQENVRRAAAARSRRVGSAHPRSAAVNPEAMTWLSR